MSDSNGTPRGPESAPEDREPDVRFGPGDTDVMPLSWASECLVWLYEQRRTVFGDMMLARLGIEPKAARGRKPANP